MVAYQKKLSQLDGRQQELVKDNFELKDLCLYLDEERTKSETTGGPGTSLVLRCPQCSQAMPQMPGDDDDDCGKVKCNGEGSSSSSSNSSSSESNGAAADTSSVETSVSSRSRCHSAESQKALEILSSFDQSTENSAPSSGTFTFETEKAILQEMCKLVQRTFDDL